MQSSIRLHSAPLVDFLGEDPEYFHQLFRMEDTRLIEAFFFALTGVQRVLRRSQTGGPKVSIDDLTSQQIERIKDYYARDYSVFGDVLGGSGSGIPRGRSVPRKPRDERQETSTAESGSKEARPIAFQASLAAPERAVPHKLRNERQEKRAVGIASKNVRPMLVFRASLAALELAAAIPKREGQKLRMLDIGGGHGIHADFFQSRVPGLQVDIVDLVKNDDRTVFSGDYLQFNPTEPYDVIWTSHVLEHVRNNGMFLDKVRADLKTDGIFACTVPPHRNNRGILEHVTTWDPMLLIINLVRAGFDASDGHFAKYKYNVSGIVRRREKKKNLLPDLAKQGYTLVADFDFKNWTKTLQLEEGDDLIFPRIEKAVTYFENQPDRGRFFFVGDKTLDGAWYYDPARAIVMPAN